MAFLTTPKVNGRRFDGDSHGLTGEEAINFAAAYFRDCALFGGILFGGIIDVFTVRSMKP